MSASYGTGVNAFCGGVDAVRHPGREPERDDIVPTVLYTKDGGASWTNLISDMVAEGVFPRGEWGWKFQQLDSKILLVSLENFRDGAILRSDDHGHNWQRLPINDRQRNANLEGIGFITPERGWVGGWGDRHFNGGYSSASTDGARNWDNANEIGFRLNRFRFLGSPPSIGYASGDRVYQYSDVPATEAFAAEPEDTPEVAYDNIVFEAEVERNDAPFFVQVWDRFGEVWLKTKREERPETGARRIVWDFMREDGLQAPAGSYVVRITMNGESISRVFYRGYGVDR